jgi:hypothetical protein
MKTQTSIPQAESGTALLAALLVVMTVGVLSATTIQLQMTSLRQQETANDRKRAFYLAEAGLSESLLSLRDGGLGQVGTKDLPASFGGGYLYTSAVEDAYGNLIIHSTGIAPRARQRLGLSVERQVLAPGSLGFFGTDSLTIGGGTQLTYVDSVDADEKTDREGAVAAEKSAPEPLPGTTPDEEYDGTVYPDSLGPRFGSNGAISVENVGLGPFTNLQADVVRGPGATLDIGLGAVVSGATAPQAEDIALPDLVWPDFPVAGNVKVTSGLAEPFTINGSHYPKVTVDSGAILRIVGPRRVSMDTLTLGPGAVLQIDSTAGPVELHVLQGLAFRASSQVLSADSNAGGLTLVVHGDDSLTPAVQIGSTGTLYGVLFAPLAAVELPPGLTWIGSVVGRTLVIPQDSSLVFDSSVLTEVAATIFHVPVSWNVLPVPKDIADPLTYRPGETYDALGVPPKRPADAVQPVEEVVKYVGIDGQEYVYRGVTGGLDVKEVATLLDTILASDPKFVEESRPDGTYVQK